MCFYFLHVDDVLFLCQKEYNFQGILQYHTMNYSLKFVYDSSEKST